MKQQYRIKLINNIAQEGLSLLGPNYLTNSEDEQAEGIMVRSSPVDIEAFPHLLTIARAGAGVNNIPVEAASHKGICVFNTPGANANAVVELLFTMLGIWLRNAFAGISFCKDLKGKKGEQLKREVEEKKKLFKGEEMAGKTLGVIGLGKIGVGVANAGVENHMRVIGFDPFPALDNLHALSPSVELSRSRSELLSQADYVTLHLPLNKKTTGLVDAEFLAVMKEGALLLNYARGEIVDEAAVLEALGHDVIQGYITDFPTEKLLGNDKVLVSPHLGASTAESEENCAIMAVKELKAYLEYGNITHSVNFPNAESIPTGKVQTRLIMINRDEPGMIGLVSNILGKHNINISSYVNESNGIIGYNIIDCESVIPDALEEEITKNKGVIRTRIIRFVK